MTPPESFSGPPPAPAPPPAGLGDPQFSGVVPSGGTWAVVIGIDRYPGGSHDLAGAVNDADDMDAALAQDGVAGDHRLVIRDQQASAGVIRAATDWLVAHASREAVAELFYAGHVRSLSEQTQALVASDGRLVTDAELASRLSGLRAHLTWIAIAGCYGGGFTELLGPGRVLTGAAPAGQLAYENEAFHRSYMGEYMVSQAMLQGRAAPTVQAAFAYAQAGISRDYPGRAPVELDYAGVGIDLRPPGAAVMRPQTGPPPSPSATRPAPTTTAPPTSAPPPSGGNTGPVGSNPSPDACTRLSFGTVHCSSP